MTPLGFEGPRRALLRTAEVAARLGYPSLTAWYADAAKRRASAFPAPTRRGLYQLGRLQDWLDAGGFEQTWTNAPDAERTTPAGHEPGRKGDRPPAASGAPPPRSEDTRENVLTFSPRAEVLSRLQAQRGAH